MRKAAATWDGDWWKLGGGGSVWDGISYDPESDLLYVGTGNAEPWPQALRTKDVSTGHDNLYVASIVAVHVETGELKWHYQMVPGDEWDYDSVQQMILADMTINGRMRKVIMQANKNGFFYVLDRITGEFISAQPFSRVTWAKGIDQKTGRPIINKEVMYGKDPQPVSPGGGGAHNWSPMSYNPQTGLVYIPTRGWDTFTYAADLDFKPDASRTGGAGQSGLKGNTRGMTVQAQAPAAGPEPLEGGDLGTLVAFDPVKQEIRWRVPVGNSRYGGTLSTASNLVFQVAPNGRLIAYTADKGEKLLELPTGLRNGMGPPITLAVDGKQYIALMGGSGGTASPGRSAEATAPMKPRLLVFGLDGTAQLPQAGADPRLRPRTRINSRSTRTCTAGGLAAGALVFRFRSGVCCASVVGCRIVRLAASLFRFNQGEFRPSLDSQKSPGFCFRVDDPSVSAVGFLPHDLQLSGHTELGSAGNDHHLTPPRRVQSWHVGEVSKEARRRQKSHHPVIHDQQARPVYPHKSLNRGVARQDDSLGGVGGESDHENPISRVVLQSEPGWCDRICAVRHRLQAHGGACFALIAGSLPAGIIGKLTVP